MDRVNFEEFAKKDKTEILQVIGSIAKEYRKKRNLYQDPVAEAMGVSQVHLSYFERGQRDLSMDHFLRLFFFLNIPLSTIENAFKSEEARFSDFLLQEQLDLLRKQEIEECIEEVAKEYRVELFRRLAQLQ